MKFQPGVSGNPLGPAPFRDLASLGYWLRRFEKELKSKQITAAQRCRLELDLIEMLMARKDVALPKQVKDEPKRKDATKTLEDLESGRSGEAGSDTVGVGNRASSL